MYNDCVLDERIENNELITMWYSGTIDDILEIHTPLNERVHNVIQIGFYVFQISTTNNNYLLKYE